VNSFLLDPWHTQQLEGVFSLTGQKVRFLQVREHHLCEVIRDANLRIGDVVIIKGNRLVRAWTFIKNVEEPQDVVVSQQARNLTRESKLKVLARAINLNTQQSSINLAVYKVGVNNLPKFEAFLRIQVDDRNFVVAQNGNVPARGIPLQELAALEGFGAFDTQIGLFIVSYTL